ncbi:phage tail tape measure protein [Tenacibaculum maritimum]|uniref:phage tail tape measure protein n=2 Tax=Tenacibaculum maritimum TaxID=107401 RepID=UPI0038763D08
MKIKFQGLINEVPMLGRAFELITNPIALVTASILSFGALSAKGVAAVEKFDSAFLPIRQLNLDKPKKEMDAYRGKIRDAAFQIGSNLTESTQAMYDLQSATGVYGDDAIEIFKKVGVYSKATGANINDAMNSTTKSMKAFGLGVNQIDSLLESNAKTVQVGITTFDELAKVQTEYAGATSAAGQTVDVGNKIFAMFTSISKNSDIAANQTKTFFDSLGAQSKNIKKYLNIEVFDTEGNMKAADKLLIEISEKFKNMSDKDITAVINKIGGAEGLKTALAKVKTGAEDMIKTFNAFDSSAFSLKEAIKNAEGDFTIMKQIFNNRLEAVFSKLGEKVVPFLAGIFDMLSPALEFVYNNFDDLTTLITTAIPIYSGLLIFFKIQKAFQVAAAATKGLTVAQWALNAAMSANPIGLIIAGVTLLITLIVFAVKKFDSWGSTLLMLMGPFGMLISAIVLIKKHWNSIINAFKSDGIIAGLKRIAVVLLDVLMHPLQRILGWVGELTGWNWAKKAKDQVANFRAKMELVTPNEKNQEEKKETQTGALYDSNSNTDGKKIASTNTDEKLKNNITKVAGDASKVRNISITIDALNKGGINVRGSETQGLTLQDVENWFNEAMMRIVRNAETS